jgi:hypothetical protein
MGVFSTLKIKDRSSIAVYQAEISEEEGQKSVSDAERNLCSKCATVLWLWDKRWPELVHPFASVIDTELPVPPSRTHLMLGSKAAWVVPNIQKGDKQFEEYPEESIEQWHRKNKLWIE